MQVKKNSEDFLSDNIARLEDFTPGAVGLAEKKGVKRSTYYTVRSAGKSCTLRTLDKLAETFKTPAWLLIHPDMKRLDQQRDWVEHILKAYLNADKEGQEFIQRAILQIEKSKATA